MLIHFECTSYVLISSTLEDDLIIQPFYWSGMSREAVTLPSAWYTIWPVVSRIQWHPSVPLYWKLPG